MFVKWHGVISGIKSLPGGGPQGTSLGLWSFLSQTNDNPEDTGEENIFKFVDDKTTLEIVNLLSIGIASHNPRSRVPSNVLSSNIFIPSENLKTQDHLNKIQQWTNEKKMKLNVSKTKNIIFNFSKNMQFSTDIRLDGEMIETVSEAKLLGTVITNDLSWKKNTDKIIKESNKRMVFLHKISKFTNNKQDLKKIYLMQIRSKLEQSAVLWHSSITQKCEKNLERVQKSALKIILGEKYISYENALKVLKLQSLKERRDELCLKFAKKCLEVPKLQKMFPRSHHYHGMDKRNFEGFQVKRGLTERMRRSAIPHMQRLLNEQERKKRDVCRQISKFKPVNNGL